MPKAPIKKTVRDQDACDLPDGSSTARELFLENHEPAELKIYALNERSISLFQKLSRKILPILPFGHQWVKSAQGKRSIVKTVAAESRKLEVVAYGPDGDKINYVFLVDGVTWQSFSHTKKGKGPKRDYPMTDADYRVLGFTYDDAKSHIRGHCTDHADTIVVRDQQYSSTKDPRNFIPEPHYKYWGCQMRRLLVRDLRKQKKGYMQFVHYPEEVLVTRDGTHVPDYLYFYSVNIDNSAPFSQRYSLSDAYSIDWNIDYMPLRPRAKKVVDLSGDYKTDGAPFVLLWDVAQSDRGTRLQVRNAYKRTRRLDSGAISTLHRSRDSLFAKTACAETEFESSMHRFFAAEESSRANEATLARSELTGGLDYCNDLLEADIRKGVVKPAQLLSLTGLFRKEAPGFEDSNDRHLDHVSQVFKDLSVS